MSEEIEKRVQDEAAAATKRYYDCAGSETDSWIEAVRPLVERIVELEGQVQNLINSPPMLAHEAVKADRDATKADRDKLARELVAERAFRRAAEDRVIHLEKEAKSAAVQAGQAQDTIEALRGQIEVLERDVRRVRAERASAEDRLEDEADELRTALDRVLDSIARRGAK